MKYFESNFNEFLNEKRTKEERLADKTTRQDKRKVKKEDRLEKRDVKGSKKEDRKKKKIQRKSKTIRRLEHRLEKAKAKNDTKKVKDLKARIKKLEGKITTIVSNYNAKDIETKLKIKYTSKTIRQLKRDDPSNKDIAVLEKLVTALKNNAEEAEINDIINEIYATDTLDALLANFKKADETATITDTEVEEQDKKAEKKIDDRKGGTPNEVAAGKKPEAQEETKRYNYYKELFKGLEKHINDATAPKLSKALAKKRIAEVQFLQKFLNDKGFFNVSEKVQFIPKEDNVDGYFGNKTEAALNKFQADNEIDQTGVADLDTWKKILDILGFSAKEDFKLNTQYIQLANKKPNVATTVAAVNTPQQPTTPAVAVDNSSNEQLNQVVDYLVSQEMSRHLIQSDEKKIYASVASLIKSGELNNSNMDEFLQLYNTKAAKSTKGRNSKGLILDLAFTFNRHEGIPAINLFIQGGQRPTNKQKFPTSPSAIDTNMKNDTKRVAHMFYWFDKLGGPKTKAALNKAGIKTNVTVQPAQK